MKWTIAESGGKEAWPLLSNKNRIMVFEFWIKLWHHFLSESSTLFVGVQLERRRRGLQQWVPGDSGWWRRRCSIHWKVWFYYCKSSSPVNKKIIFYLWICNVCMKHFSFPRFCGNTTFGNFPSSSSAIQVRNVYDHTNMNLWH